MEQREDVKIVITYKGQNWRVRAKKVLTHVGRI